MSLSDKHINGTTHPALHSEMVGLTAGVEQNTISSYISPQKLITGKPSIQLSALWVPDMSDNPLVESGEADQECSKIVHSIYFTHIDWKPPPITHYKPRTSAYGYSTTIPSHSPLLCHVEGLYWQLCQCTPNSSTPQPNKLSFTFITTPSILLAIARHRTRENYATPSQSIGTISDTKMINKRTNQTINVTSPLPDSKTPFCSQHFAHTSSNFSPQHVYHKHQQYYFVTIYLRQCFYDIQTHYQNTYLDTEFLNTQFF